MTKKLVGPLAGCAAMTTSPRDGALRETKNSIVAFVSLYYYKCISEVLRYDDKNDWLHSRLLGDDFLELP
jgi:hypothetical protein